jgi:hypothetical protein
MADQLTASIAVVLARAPEWIRQELASSEPAVRNRAEETLAAMIAAALHPAGEGGSLKT